jgi:2-desacetyl-2-hydroxyethyl bacteriochlorophyllide A dehydrogenase
MSEPTIRQVVVTAPGVVEIRHTARPEPGPGEVLIRMRAVGICGSDVHAFHGRHPFVPTPYHPGHEVVGTVEAVGAGVDLPVGRRVVIEPILACGRCKYCLDGRYNLCATLAFFGCTAPTGGLADLFVLPAGRALPVPDQLSDALAALVEPLSTPVHAVRLAGLDLTGRTVAILGAGTIGLLTLVAARQAGAARIAVSDTVAAKRDLARRLGADSVHDAAAPAMVEAIRDDLGTSGDVVFDCVAVQQTLDQAIAIALKGGTVVVVGVPAAPVTVPLPEIQDRQVRIQGSAMYTREDIARSVAMLTDGLIEQDDLVTARYPFARVAEAFDEASSGRQVKVMVTADAATTAEPADGAA